MKKLIVVLLLMAGILTACTGEYKPVKHCPKAKEVVARYFFFDMGYRFYLVLEDGRYVYYDKYSQYPELYRAEGAKDEIGQPQCYITYEPVGK